CSIRRAWRGSSWPGRAWRPRRSSGEGLLLEPGQLRAAGHAEVEQLVEQVAAERLTLGGALDLDETAVPGTHHVHVGLRRDVLLVAEVQPGLRVHDPDADRRHRADQRVTLAPLPLLQPGDRVGERHEATGDRGGAGAAVRLQHVTVDDDGALAERLGIHA